MTFSAKRAPVDNLLHKAKSLLVPYLCFSLIYLAYLWVKAVALGGPAFNLVSGLQSIVLLVSGRAVTSVYGLWFFPCLFLTEIILYCIVPLKRWQSILFSILVVTICILIHQASGVVSIISILSLSLCFTATGYYARKRIDEYRSSLCVAMPAFWFLQLLCGRIITSTAMCSISAVSRLATGHLYVICGFAGSMFIYCCASHLSKNALLNCHGRDSMYYYGLHYCLIGIAERIPYIGATGQTLLVMVALYPLIALWHRFKSIKAPNL